MSRGGLVDDYHKEVCNNISLCRQLRAWLDAIAHKNTCMKVMEISAGNRSITEHILEPLRLHGHTADGVARCVQYAHTEPSEAFLELA